MTHEACKSKLRSVVRSSMHPYPGNWVAIGRAVVYYALATRAFSAGIRCWHCICTFIALAPAMLVIPSIGLKPYAISSQAS